MPAGLEIIDGNASLVLRDHAAWHDMGTIIDGAFNWETAYERSRANYTVAMDQLHTRQGKPIEGKYYTYRTDNGEYLGSVSDRYQIVQNRDAFTFLDSLVENGELSYESAGVLGKGERFWALARMPGFDEIAEGDDVARYVMFGHGHDGKTPIYAQPTKVRIVCANTFASATVGFDGIRHTGDVKLKLEDARKYISQFDAAFTLFRDSGRLLATRKVAPADMKEYINKLFPVPKESDGTLQISGRGATIREKNVEAVKRAFLLPRNQLPSIQGSWWQLLNSVTDTIDHNGKKLDTAERREKNFVDLTSGRSADFKTMALNLALEMSA